MKVIPIESHRDHLAALADSLDCFEMKEDMLLGQQMRRMRLLAQSTDVAAEKDARDEELARLARQTEKARAWRPCFERLGDVKL